MVQNPRPVRVLSIDGGGVRGYLPALLLTELERRAGQPTARLFDLIVGTSTGAIIGIGLAAGLRAAQLTDFYTSHGRTIFSGFGPVTWKDRVLGRPGSLAEKMGNAARKVGGPFGGHNSFSGSARHRSEGLISVLQDVLNGTRLSQASIDLAVASYDAAAQSPVVFTRHAAQADARFDLPLWEVARATSAAPTFFPPHETVWAGRHCSFVDGGVWANNPAGIALIESMRLTAARNLTATSVQLVSLGTGAAPGKDQFERTASWLGSAVDMVAVATSVRAGEVLASLAIPPGQRWRFQVIDSRVAGAMDDPSPARLDALRSAADQLIASRSTDIDAVIASLRRPEVVQQA